ncbi:hypothetical protein C8R44DRAFT_726749 [Mycena epipterygia]|nr:hypothetical protein C8R44DRAFT_726749 [Mycena epipterygia]
MASRLPSVYRVLFTNDEYEGEIESDREYSPRSSPIRDPVTPVRTRKPETSDSGATLVNSESATPVQSEASPAVRVVPDSPCGLVRFQHWTLTLSPNEAMQEISCEYSKLHKMYLQYIQFSIGGVAAPQIAGTVSPRAVFRTWPADSSGTEPFWVKYHKFGYALRVVSTEFAIGRLALLASCTENICISANLLKWAQKLNPLALELPAASLQWLLNVAPEDNVEED